MERRTAVRLWWLVQSRTAVRLYNSGWFGIDVEPHGRAAPPSPSEKCIDREPHGGAAPPPNDKDMIMSTWFPPPLWVSSAVCAVIGLIGGSAFWWASRAWSIFIAAFLWALIGTVGTVIGRSAGERLRHGDWKHATRLAPVQTIVPMGGFLGVALLVGAPLNADQILVVCGIVLALAMLFWIGLPLTSPFRERK